MKITQCVGWAERSDTHGSGVLTMPGDKNLNVRPETKPYESIMLGTPDESRDPFCRRRDNGEMGPGCSLCSGSPRRYPGAGSAIY